MQGYRKQLKRFHEPGDVHELTFSTYRQFELLTRDDWRRMLCHSIDRAVTNHKYQLVAFVLMTNHVHLLVFPTEVEPGELRDLDVLLSAIKRPFSYRVKQTLIAEESSLLRDLTVMERPGKPQEGAGYDRNLRTEKKLCWHPSITSIQTRCGPASSLGPVNGSGRVPGFMNQTRRSWTRNCRRFMDCHLRRSGEADLTWGARFPTSHRPNAGPSHAAQMHSKPGDVHQLTVSTDRQLETPGLLNYQRRRAILIAIWR